MLRFGACYHPEQWTAEQAKDHIKLMVKARMNVVRMGEACWCKFEPEQGRFRFEWLDPVIEALHKEGIATVLCTPTAIAPLWVHVRYPNILRTAHSDKAVAGEPHACCVNASEFQILTDTVVQSMARHYAKADGIIGWQVDNALGFSGHSSWNSFPYERCYCEHCMKAFRKWLLAKYKTTEQLNQAWCAACNGVEVRQWNEVVLPRGETVGAGPGAWLDFARFSSDSLIAYHKRQADLLKTICTKHFVTNNAWPIENDVDIVRLMEHVDVGGVSSITNRDDSAASSYSLATARGAKSNYWTMEQLCGVTHRAYARGERLLTAEPGALRRWAWQSIANGASGVLFSPFRAALGGSYTERDGVLDWDGVPRRRFKEVMLTGDEFKKIGPEIENTRIDAKVALVRGYDALWSYEGEEHGDRPDYEEELAEVFRAVTRTGNACDVISPRADFKNYSIVLAPALTVIDDDTARRFEDFARNGGTLIFTPQSGSREISNARMSIPLPGLLAPLAGATIDELIIGHGPAAEISFARGSLIAQKCTVAHWMEILELIDAESWAEYLDGRLKGKCAISRRSVGKGQVIYMGVHLPFETLRAFIGEYLPDFPMKEIPEGVEVIQRKGEKGRLIFVLNHSGERQNLKLPGQFPDLLTGEIVGPGVTISANGILVLKA
jgi:beta-galactosidase